MNSKILILGVIIAIALIVVFLTLQKEEVKVHNVEEAIVLLKENYSVSNNYSVVNITNGWRFEFLKTDGNCSLECVETHIYFDVYKNGTIIKNAQLKNVTRIENENDALNYVLYKFPEFKKIKKCEFEEKLMCHEDIIINKTNDSWNITFMNESRGCNNECVIEHYYSFIVEKNGKINKEIEKERMITLNDFAAEVRRCNENLTFIGSKWFAKPEEAPADAILTRWYFESIKKSINIESTYGEAHLVLYESPYIDVLIQGTYIIDGKPYLLLIDTHSNVVYRINKTEFVYNIILEKFSTKTINNESDVLEAFERYLKLFGLEGYQKKYSSEGKIIGKENVTYYPSRVEEFIKKMKCKTYKENNSWMLECEIDDCAIEGNWKAMISEKGRVYIIEKDIKIHPSLCRLPL